MESNDFARLSLPILILRLGFSFGDLSDTFPEGEMNVSGEISNDSFFDESFETSVKFKGPAGENDIVKIKWVRFLN
jgi:hypothetical protein